jgi:SOS-response transcriptional repressor LexA
MDDKPQKGPLRPRANVTDLDNVIATNVRDALAVRGLSQRGFAIRLGISPQLMNAYVNGKQPIGKGTLTRISAALDIPEYMFLQRDPFGEGSKEAFSIAPHAPQAPRSASIEAPQVREAQAPASSSASSSATPVYSFPGSASTGASYDNVAFPEGSPSPSGTGAFTVNKIPVISWIRAGALHEPCDIFLPGFAEEWTVYDTRDSNAFALRVVGNSMEPEFREGDIIIVSPAVEPVSGEYVVAKYRGRVTFKKLRTINRGSYEEVRLIPLNIVEHDVIEISGDDVRELKIIGKVIGKTVRY